MAGTFSTDTLERIRAASDIVDIIGGALPLKRAGANFVTLCPFHREKSPSFNINPHKQIFHCFGCHKGGDVFTFVQEYEGVSFGEAVTRLAERARIPLEFDESPVARQHRFIKDTLLDLHEQVTKRWQSALRDEPAAQIARDYLARRGVPQEAIDLFRLGYAPDDWEDTVNWAKARGFDLAIVEQGGLILRSERDQTRHYGRFRGRLMFPICDEQGRVVGFSGRVLEGDEKTAKYVNSPETPIFRKGRVFFGLDKSKRAILDANFAIICEGQLDLIACHMAGVKNVVAPQGTALTSEHTRILKRYVDEVVLCFDSDSAGRKATIRALDDLLSSGLAARVAVIPAPEDPDSFIRKHGAAAFETLVREARGFFEFYLDHLCTTEDLRTDRGRSAIVGEIGSALAKTGNAVLTDTFAQKTALRLAVSPEAVRREFAKLASRSASRPADRQPSGEPGTEPEDTLPDSAEQAAAVEEIKPPSPQEAELFRLLLRFDDLVPIAQEHLQVDWLQHPVIRSVIHRIISQDSDHPWEGPAALMSQIIDPVTRTLVSEALAGNRPVHDPQACLAGVLTRLRDLWIKRTRSELSLRLGQLTVGDSEHIEIADRLSQLRALASSPIRFGG